MKKQTKGVAPLRLIKWCAQWQEKNELYKVPGGSRGVYALHYKGKNPKYYNVVYVGMSSSGHGIMRRLRSHSKSKRKSSKWTHFSIFVIWENIREEEIRELEALVREIYRKDETANSLAKQKGSVKLRSVRFKKSNEWPRKLDIPGA
ncbi:MAG TPA: hypothetical protein VHF01_14660 [Candidatus Acidoferrum sp.]|nr:hypothetical protein [Candidatus Acidoferrum sp.]